MGGFWRNLIIKWASSQEARNGQQRGTSSLPTINKNVPLFYCPFYRPLNYQISAHGIKWFTSRAEPRKSSLHFYCNENCTYTQRIKWLGLLVLIYLSVRWRLFGIVLQMIIRHTLCILDQHIRCIYGQSTLADETCCQDKKNWLKNSYWRKNLWIAHRFGSASSYMERNHDGLIG